MTTNTTPSQAASIAEDYEFVNLAANYGMAWTHPKPEVEKHHLAKLASYIDTKLAQARNTAWAEGRNQCYVDALERSAVKGLKQDRDDWKNRATAAESRLAEIQRGVEGLLQYIADHDWGGIPEPVPQIDALRALLKPQGQADTSGLPG